MHDNLLDSDIKEMAQDMRKYDKEMVLATYYPRIYAIRCFFMIKLPGYFAKYVTCQIFGHDEECEDWATPDYGGMSWYCKRNCGAGRTEYFY